LKVERPAKSTAGAERGSIQGSVTLYVLLSCLGCDAVYTLVGVTTRVWTSLPADTMLNADRIANFLSCGPSKKCSIRWL